MMELPTQLNVIYVLYVYLSRIEITGGFYKPVLQHLAPNQLSVLQPALKCFMFYTTHCSIVSGEHEAHIC